MKTLRLAVIGTGHLGRIHTRLLKSLEDVEDLELVGVVDPVEDSRQAVAQEFGTQQFACHTEVAGEIDAAIVAAPTQHHHAIVADLLKKNVHVLVEKPVTLDVDQADDLVAIAKQKKRVLQVGHVERFNPALSAAQPYVAQPKYIEATRASGYTFRSVDVGVVLDLMIHDIDVVLSLARSKVVQVQALGAAVFGPHEDMAQARLTFENGCVANLTASRCSYQPQRTMNVFSGTGFAAIDFGACTAKVIQPSAELLNRELDVHSLPAEEKTAIRENLFESYLPVHELEVQRGNAILDEQTDFVTSIRSRRSPVVCGEQGRDAVAVAKRIISKIEAHRWNGASEGPCGPLAIAEPSVLAGPGWAKVGDDQKAA